MSDLTKTQASVAVMHYQTVGRFKSRPLLAVPSSQFPAMFELLVDGNTNLFPGSHFVDVKAARRHCNRDRFVSDHFETTGTDASEAP